MNVQSIYPFLEGFAPNPNKVLANRSCPYCAAICKGVEPFLSEQSIIAPELSKNTLK